MARIPTNIVKRKRKNKNKHVYYLRETINGKQIWRSLGTEVLKEAKRKAPLIRARLEESIEPVLAPTQVPTTTVRAFYTEWM